MREFYVRLIYKRVVQRCIDLGMPQQLLKLFNGHALFDCHSSHSPAEFMRMYVPYPGGGSQPCEKTFYTGNRKALPGCMQADKKGRIFITAGCQILLKMDFGLGVKIDAAFLISFSQNNAFSFGKINIRTVEIYQFAYPDSGGNQKIYHGKIPGMPAPIPQTFQIFIGKSFLYQLSCLDFMDPADGTLHNIVLILQPGKERRYDTPDIVNGDFAGVMDFLITRQVKTDIIGFYFADFFLNKIDHVEQGGGVIFNGVF